MLGDKWQTSSQSFSNSNCVQAKWRKSRHSYSEANCVEVADGTTVLVRDSKLGDRSPVLEFSPAEWEKFLARVRAL